MLEFLLLPSSPWKGGTTPSPLHASPAWQTLAAAVPRQCAWLCLRPHLQHWHHCLHWPAVAPSLRVPGWQPSAALSGYGCSSSWRHSDPWREELQQSELLLPSLAEEECCICGARWGPRSQDHLRQDSSIQISKSAMWSSPLYLSHMALAPQISRKGGSEAKYPTDTQITFSWWRLEYDNSSPPSHKQILELLQANSQGLAPIKQYWFLAACCALISARQSKEEKNLFKSDSFCPSAKPAGEGSSSKG